MNFFLTFLVLFIFTAYFSQESIARKEDIVIGGLTNNIVANNPYAGKDSLTSNKNPDFSLEEPSPPTSVDEMLPLPPLEEPSPPMPVDEMPPLPPLEEALPPLPLDEVQPFPSTEEAPSLPVIDETPPPLASGIASIDLATEDMRSPNSATEQHISLAPTDESSPPLPTGAADNVLVLGGASNPEATPTGSISELSKDNQHNISESAQPKGQASVEAKQVAQAAAQDQYQARALQKAQQRQIARDQLMEQHDNSGNSQSQNQDVQRQMSLEQFQKEAIQRSEQRQANQILDAQEAAEQQERERAQQKRERIGQQKVEKRGAPIEITKADTKAEVGQNSRYQSASQMEKKPFKDVNLTDEISRNQTISEYEEAQFSGAFTDEHGNFIGESESKNDEAIESGSHDKQEKSE